MIAVWLWPAMTTLTVAACALFVIGVTIGLTLYGLDDRRGQLWFSASVRSLIVFFAARVLDAYILAHG